jgi:hypothetical protein
MDGSTIVNVDFDGHVDIRCKLLDGNRYAWKKTQPLQH